MSEFPRTDKIVLRRAADGDWNEFFQQYLSACWREIEVQCRQRGLRLADSHDLIQELVVKLMREGAFNRDVRDELVRNELSGDFRGNLAARYLYHRDSPLKSAQFRTYLKAAIRHLIIEWLRRHRREQFHSISHHSNSAVWMDQSIHLAVDRNWMIGCLHEAAREFRADCDRANTRGIQRWSIIMRLSIVDGLTVNELAASLGLDRSTVSESLQNARNAFVVVLQRVSGIESIAELKDLLSDLTGELQCALATELPSEASSNSASCEPRRMNDV